MQAFGLNHPDGPFIAANVPDLHPHAGQFTVAPLAVGLNNRDRIERMTAPDGRFTIPGHDVAGRVIDPGTTDFTPGQLVLAHTDHAYAEQVLATPDTALALPPGLALAKAAAVITPGITAWRIVHRFATIQPGQTVIVKGANGGVGALVVQLATALGADVIGIASARHQEAVVADGALRAVPYDNADLVTVLANAGDVVINVAMDGIGFTEDAVMTRPGGQLVTVAHVAGRAEDKKIQVTHVHPANTPSDAVALAALAPAVADGSLRLHVADPLPFTLAGLQRGHELLGQPHDGRLVLVKDH
ncbi:MAG: zinc-binding dehydrogenase [Lactobacillus sp.]|jgi:NADPH:quinone reductase-like Zn-dependent oxidoreductase|nr:zinc-binding dehydrogenase [Lactobacillus sp.]MCI2033286.1 zinc-binding dehydrogenase [Lactobacillus sp.]